MLDTRDAGWCRKNEALFFLRLPQPLVSRAPCPLRSLERGEKKKPLVLRAILVSMIPACGYAISRQNNLELHLTMVAIPVN